MKIANLYSHLNGYEYMLVHRKVDDHHIDHVKDNYLM